LLILELSNLVQIIIRVIVVGGTIADICMHYCEKYQLMIIKVLSKFELKRLCKAVGATALTRLGSPTLEELGTADEVFVQEIGS
jgi:T-complex protein 1 subunit theta